MCQARFDNGAFDPAFCPLLAGLSPEEIAERLANDPMIRACAGIGGAPKACPSADGNDAATARRIGASASLGLAVCGSAGQPCCANPPYLDQGLVNRLHS